MNRALLLCLVVALAGCSRGHDVVAGTVEEGNGNLVAHAVTKGGDGTTTTTVRGPDGTATISTGAAAASASIPAGFSLYPGARITSNVSVAASAAQGGSNGMIAFESADAPDRIVAYYKQAAAQAGYKVQSELTSGAMSMIAGQREGEEQGFTLTVNRTGDKSEATLIGGR